LFHEAVVVCLQLIFLPSQACSDLRAAVAFLLERASGLFHSRVRTNHIYTTGYTRFSMSSKRNSIVNSLHSIIIAFFLVIATSISVIGVVSNQPQITMAQQQQPQVVNQTASILKQQPNLLGVKQ
jgi:hypothetical protein